MIKIFLQNRHGKDYICSDIHGHFSLLSEQLAQINFNEQTDRLFSLGDLIDRGDESAQGLEWLAKPWFFAIQGNHERMLINAFESRSESLWFQWMMWGGNWAEDMDFDALEPFYLALSQLLLAIELALPNKKLLAWFMRSCLMFVTGMRLSSCCCTQRRSRLKRHWRPATCSGAKFSLIYRQMKFRELSQCAISIIYFTGIPLLRTT